MEEREGARVEKQAARRAAEKKHENEEKFSSSSISLSPFKPPSFIILQPAMEN